MFRRTCQQPPASRHSRPSKRRNPKAHALVLQTSFVEGLVKENQTKTKVSRKHTSKPTTLTTIPPGPKPKTYQALNNKRKHPRNAEHTHSKNTSHRKPDPQLRLLRSRHGSAQAKKPWTWLGIAALCFFLYCSGFRVF